MNKSSRKYRKKELEIDAVEVTNDRLTGRVGLTLFESYLQSIQLFPLLDRYFGSIRKSKKDVVARKAIRGTGNRYWIQLKSSMCCLKVAFVANLTWIKTASGLITTTSILSCLKSKWMSPILFCIRAAATVAVNG
jgi:hypothetical protein